MLIGRKFSLFLCVGTALRSLVGKETVFSSPTAKHCFGSLWKFLTVTSGNGRQKPLQTLEGLEALPHSLGPLQEHFSQKFPESCL